MSERIWTQKQLAAIETRDRTLLVSAAAGSGKTATLTERIIRSLMDEENPVSVDSLLVVTFTKAAASELRAKISAALSDAVEKNPDNKSLARQLFLLPEAKIKTIDSFCADVLRQNADSVGVPFNYRIADVAECQLISRSILEAMIEAVYSAQAPEIATPEEFEALADCLTDSKRAEELYEVFAFVYERCESSIGGIETVRELVEKFNPEKFTSVEKAEHGAYLLGLTKDTLSHYASLANDYYHKIFGDGTEKFKAVVLSDFERLDAVSKKVRYCDMRDAMMNLSFDRKPTIRGDKPVAAEHYSEIRDAMKDDIKKLLSYYTYTEQQWRELYSGLYSRLTVLYRFLARFDELFVKEKLRRGALSYADVERFCYLCLVKDGERTDVAKNLERSFDAVYIDEYQDVNSLQNSIFEAISRDDNRFMVGDIKQSIYGFRSARPEIFAEMKRRYPSLDASAKQSAASIFMSNNFRCDRGVVDFVNSVFDKAFALTAGSIGYVDEDRLIYSKLGRSDYKYPEVCMLNKTADDEDADTAPDVVARKIEELLSVGTLNDGRPITPSDIAIIMRNASGKDHLYAEALSKRGIPVRISGAKNFFLSSEILLTLCLLNSIDNPRRDIYLAGLMCSPLYSFTANELYIIRKEGVGEALYDALVDYCRKNGGFNKGRDFLYALDKYRQIAEGVSAAELLYRLYNETGLLALAARDGGKDNLMLLYDYAREFEAGEFQGLYNFIHFINSLIDKRTTFDDNREADNTDAVNVVTCHGSKGLEYPVVFLVDAGAKIRNHDSKKRLVYSEDFGIAIRLRTPSGLAVVNNPIFDLVNHFNFSKAFEEELRVLYVAITRAREHLYTVGVCPVIDREKYLDSLEIYRECLDEYSIKQLSSYLEIMLVTSGVSPLGAEDFVGRRPEEKSKDEACDTELGFIEESIGENELEELFLQRFIYKYPKKYLTELPKKMSVSRMSPTVLDGADGEEHILFDEPDGRSHIPAFISGGVEDESAKRGIATHYFMQFCDLENLAVRGAEAELCRLIDLRYISKEDGERVRISELELFRKSRLFSEMRGAAALYRELRFNVKLPANLFTESDERREAYSGKDVLVQGVIDCIIEYEDGSLGVFDYKTDRLSREMLADKKLAAEFLTEKHRAQLTYYAHAVERIFGKKPTRVEVYSLPLGDTVCVI
ncbi:MAG: UvrD-helicase domain-containing protein [Clostridia bacterium]|nr:UvrD-helicase domain-containing protein [Clostridia bacterium]